MTKIIANKNNRKFYNRFIQLKNNESSKL